jgi:hypothetical protein
MQTVGAASRPLMKKECVSQGMSEDNTQAFSTKIESVQVPFAATMGADGDSSSSQAKYMSITRMQHYNKYSFEEIRVGDYLTQIATADRQEPASSMTGVASSASTSGLVLLTSAQTINRFPQRWASAGLAPCTPHSPATQPKFWDGTGLWPPMGTGWLVRMGQRQNVQAWAPTSAFAQIVVSAREHIRGESGWAAATSSARADTRC